MGNIKQRNLSIREALIKSDAHDGTDLFPPYCTKNPCLASASRQIFCTICRKNLSPPRTPRFNQRFLSIIRCIATWMIVACHILQFMNNPLAFWLNCGVQIFLFMSGFLYGAIERNQTILTFYRRSFVRILTDYVIVMIPMLLMLKLFFMRDLSITHMVMTLFARKTVVGGEHMWFVPFIIFCYLLTPLFLYLFKRMFQFEKDRYVFLSFLCMIIFIHFFSLKELSLNAHWMSCFVLGMFCGFCEKERRKRLSALIRRIIVFLALFINGLYLAAAHFALFQMTPVISDFLFKCGHVMIGASIFVLLKKLIDRLLSGSQHSVLQTVCSFFDRISYDIYLIHHFFILGTMSLMRITDHLAFNIVVILAITMALSVIVSFLSKKIKPGIEQGLVYIQDRIFKKNIVQNGY